jgi:RimJ/RimL family protein N-acetyltransferase
VTGTGHDRGEQPVLEGNWVRLRPWRADDAPAVYEACQDDEVQRWTEVPVPYLRSHADEYVTDTARRAWDEGGALFAVERRDGGPLVGAMGLLALRDGVGVVGYWTVAAHRGQGLTGEALRILSAWVLDGLGARRVELVALADNAGSRRVAERAGFRHEGTLRQRSVHRGRPVDDAVYSLLVTDPRRPPAG